MATQYDNDTNKHFHERWKTKQENFPKNVDHFFLLIMSIIIFFMQCGFAFMEAGAVRYVSYLGILDLVLVIPLAGAAGDSVVFILGPRGLYNQHF